jgi:hypothetical protein
MKKIDGRESHECKEIDFRWRKVAAFAMAIEGMFLAQGKDVPVNVSIVGESLRRNSLQSRIKRVEQA